MIKNWLRIDDRQGSLLMMSLINYIHVSMNEMYDIKCTCHNDSRTNEVVLEWWHVSCDNGTLSRVSEPSMLQTLI